MQQPKLVGLTLAIQVRLSFTCVNHMLPPSQTLIFFSIVLLFIVNPCLSHSFYSLFQCSLPIHSHMKSSPLFFIFLCHQHPSLLIITLFYPSRFINIIIKHLFNWIEGDSSSISLLRSIKCGVLNEIDGAKKSSRIRRSQDIGQEENSKY